MYYQHISEICINAPPQMSTGGGVHQVTAFVLRWLSVSDEASPAFSSIADCLRLPH